MVKLESVAGPSVGALEVPYEGVPELNPDVDPPLGEVLEPGACGVDKEQSDALDDE
jgi:hypothetical protein